MSVRCKLCENVNRWCKCISFEETAEDLEAREQDCIDGNSIGRRELALDLTEADTQRTAALDSTAELLW